MAATLSHLVAVFHFLILLLLLLMVQGFSNPDFDALLSFKTASDTSQKLTTWNINSTNPCSWKGVSCIRDRVSRLVLENLDLEGSIHPLTSLTQLRVLSLKGNRFSGPVPNLSNLTALKLLFLSRNAFSGEFPATVKSLFRLYRLDLSNNNFSGEIPAKVDASTTSNKSHGKGGSKISPVALIAIIVCDVLVLAIVSLLLYCYFWRNYKLKEGKGSKLFESEKIVYSSSPYPAQGGFERGRMVFFEGEKRFELEDLLRASAEMLGKGGFGTAYKAVLDDGNVVAVKRLKDAQITGKREFEQHMELLGRLRHPNVVSLRAYYFAREEKLLVYDYMPNATLFWLLHGNRGPGRTPLDWTTRLKIAAGAARGVAFIHNSCKSLKLTHGNIKSTNVLLDKQGNARVSDFGLSVFAGPGPVGGRSNGYRAPEASEGRKQTQKSDVYSFGVLLLELLTGKCPSVVESGGSGDGGVVDLPRWVQSVVREEWTAEVFDLELMRYKDIEEEMVGLLQIAMTCTAPAPDQRPRMTHVLKMIEELRGVEVSPCHDSLDSVSESPSLSEDACGTTSQ
ncbi:Putative leucine-rich repeat receptor-like protein kinase [Glycine soja]|nr:Putative leucine-rich repeat receptor-like protein kinase [Glycine soja]